MNIGDCIQYPDQVPLLGESAMEMRFHDTLITDAASPPMSRKNRRVVADEPVEFIRDIIG